MIAGEPVCVLDDALFIDIHEDLLPTHGTHAVGEVFGGHARLTVELEESRREGQKSCERRLPGAHAASAVRKQGGEAGAQRIFSFSWSRPYPRERCHPQLRRVFPPQLN